MKTNGENYQKTSTQAMTVYNTSHGEVKLSPGIVRKYLVSGDPSAVTDQEVVMFMAMCKFQGLNPFLREAYLIKYGKDNPATMVVGKDVFTKRAAAEPQYDGAVAGVILQVGDKVEYRDGTFYTPATEKLVGGWAKVFRKDQKQPTVVSVSLDEYMGVKKDGTPNRQWAKMPGTMIRKVALVQALREAFPERLQDLYDASEMQVEEELSIKPVELPFGNAITLTEEDKKGAEEAFDKPEQKDIF